MQDPQSLHKYAYVHGDPITNTDPSGEMSLGSTLGSIGITTGKIAIGGGVVAGVASFAYSQYLGLGLLHSLRNAVLVGGGTAATIASLGVGSRLLAYTLATSGLLATASGGFETWANAPVFYYDPTLAQRTNAAWLNRFSEVYAGSNANDVAKAKSALANILNHASNLDTPRYLTSRVIGQACGIQENAPCGEWADSVWVYMSRYLNQHPDEKTALRNLGIDFNESEWQGRYAASHFTIGIVMNTPSGIEKWEIDNGYAFPNIPRHHIDSYAIGTPFPQAWWDNDPLRSRFISFEPGKATLTQP